MQNEKIAFIGGGNMAHSLIGGLISNKYPPHLISVSDPHRQKLEILKKCYGINTSQNNDQIIAEADIVILAIKPQLIGDIIRGIAAEIKHFKPLIISIAAGIHIKYISDCLGTNAAIIRCMPNTPALLQAGATALFANPNVTTAQCDLAESIMRSVGITVWLEKEQDMDVVTALSGSGPAYFFFIMESLEKAAISHGLSPEVVHLLTIQTALGASKMALESKESISVLRERVTSPGGTTEQAIKVFETHRLHEILEKGLTAAKNQSVELAKYLEN